jgi:hypothetical protein
VTNSPSRLNTSIDYNESPSIKEIDVSIPKGRTIVPGIKLNNSKENHSQISNPKFISQSKFNLAVKSHQRASTDLGGVRDKEMVNKYNRGVRNSMQEPATLEGNVVTKDCFGTTELLD